MSTQDHTTQPLPTESNIAAILTRIAEALEKQNELTEELERSIDGVAQAIFNMGAYA